MKGAGMVLGVAASGLWGQNASCFAGSSLFIQISNYRKNKATTFVHFGVKRQKLKEIAVRGIWGCGLDSRPCQRNDKALTISAGCAQIQNSSCEDLGCEEVLPAVPGSLRSALCIKYGL